MRPSAPLAGLLLLIAPALAADSAVSVSNVPNLSTVSQPNGAATTAAAATTDAKTTDAKSSDAKSSDAKSTSAAASSQSLSDFSLTPTVTGSSTVSQTASGTESVFKLSDVPTIAGYGVPDVIVPSTANAPFMQKSNLPDGTVFIIVAAVLGFLGAAVLAWRGLVAWSLHRSVKRAAMAQNLADLKTMAANPGGKKRGMYNVVGANSNMSLDHLSAAPTGTSRPSKPFAKDNPAGTPPRSTSSLFFSPTAGGAAGLRDSTNRSSSYLPAGYYPTGNAQPASGSPMTHIGGHGAHLSTHSLATPGNRFSSRSGISPPTSPSLPPSRGYDRAPPSRDGLSMYDRRSVATVGNSAANKSIYGYDQSNPSQLSLNVPGGTSVAGGRAPSAYLEDLFENHGNGPRERH